MQRLSFKSTGTARLSAADAISKMETYMTGKYSAKCARNNLRAAERLMKIHAVTTPDLCFANSIREEMIKAGKAPAYVYNVMHTIEIWAASQGIKLTVDKPKVAWTRFDSLTTEEAGKLLEAAGNVRDKAILAVMLYGGLRLKEVINANMGDYAPSKRLLFIRDNRDSDIKFPGIKNGKEAAVVLTREAARILDDYIESRPIVDTRALFISTLGKRLGEKTIENLCADTGKRAGISRHVHPHLCRHTCFTLMVKNNINLALISRQARHSSIHMTMRYCHPDDDMLREQIDAKFTI